MGFSSLFAKPMLSNIPCIIQLRNRSTSYGEMERFFDICNTPSWRRLRISREAEGYNYNNVWV